MPKCEGHTVYWVCYNINRSKGHRSEGCYTIVHWGLGFVARQCHDGSAMSLY